MGKLRKKRSIFWIIVMIVIVVMTDKTGGGVHRVTIILESKYLGTSGEPKIE